MHRIDSAEKTAHANLAALEQYILIGTRSEKRDLTDLYGEDHRDIAIQGGPPWQ